MIDMSFRKMAQIVARRRGLRMGWLDAVTAIEGTEDQGLSHGRTSGHREEGGVQEQPNSNQMML